MCVKIETSKPSSRRDQMKVARHEMPGKSAGMFRPVGNGMIIDAGRGSPSQAIRRRRQPIKPYPTGRGLPLPRFQAFHTWLPSRVLTGQTDWALESQT
jgi:hypothetical protein